MSGLFTDRLLVHFEKIDEQHKEIFRIIEKFYSTCMNESSKEKLIEAFNNLKIYLEQHFEYEENYMIKYKFHDYEAHKEKHNIFMRKIYALDSAFRGNYIPFTKITEANDFFSEGFVTHISEVDSELGEFLKEKF